MQDPGQCNLKNDSNCCKDGKFYMTYKCSPPMLSSTKAMLTLNNFEAGGDGSGLSKCNNQYHSNDDLAVALSTGWFNYEKRCLKYINIHNNGKSMRAKVVDECDLNYEYQFPCFNNIVDSSKAI
ncbi:kiwellin-like [Gossypium australe]|uniref:Kiwellin-like n=1 Tax=Gossypium australe TaxID=47621 RepID=A0A5B6UZ97_9ROSI|nr:kiwellin-like [Gossypium australe]